MLLFSSLSGTPSHGENTELDGDVGAEMIFISLEMILLKVKFIKVMLGGGWL